MDKLSKYRDVVKRVLSEMAQFASRHERPGVETVCAFDDERGQYLLMSVGWEGNRRQRGTHLYLRIRDGKVWVEDDWTEEGVANSLVRAGVPKEDIVLGFQAPMMRKMTEFAVA
jgi:hypothetical protein